MSEIFIEKIHINECRHIKDLTIPLSDTEKKHLIITGKNGSGKTSLLEELNKIFMPIFSILDPSNSNNDISDDEYMDDRFNGVKNVEIDFNKEIFDLFASKNLQLYSYFPAKRKTDMLRPSGIQAIDFNKVQKKQKINSVFLQYIVNLKAERSFSRDDGDIESVERIDSWFLNFENHLKNIFDCQDLVLEFDRKKYNFLIKEGDRKTYDFNTLPDGYSSVLDIITELILKMEARDSMDYKMAGVVLIDEIETHLHVDMQKKILPFLTDFFPNIQFIVTTHSPFVLSSISDSVICDLEKRTVYQDFSQYSYESLIEGYFSTDQYSGEIKQKVKQFEKLSEQEILSETESVELNRMEEYFNTLTSDISLELQLKIQQIRLKRLGR